PAAASVFNRYNIRRDAVQAEAAERRNAYLAPQRGHDARDALDREEMTRCEDTTLGHDTPISAPCDIRRPAQAIEIAECERGDLNPTCDRENPAFSRIATVKDRRRRSRIVPDRHNLAGADERKPKGGRAAPLKGSRGSRLWGLRCRPVHSFSRREPYLARAQAGGRRPPVTLEADVVAFDDVVAPTPEPSLVSLVDHQQRLLAGERVRRPLDSGPQPRVRAMRGRNGPEAVAMLVLVAVVVDDVGEVVSCRSAARARPSEDVPFVDLVPLLRRRLEVGNE